MKKKPQHKNSKRSKNNTLRIIGGDWRSRKLPIVDAEGLRPTPDRVRETLFNWLQSYIHGACCLDLFAGSGILGLEALSRGANSVDFIELNKTASKQIKTNLSLLNTSGDKANVYTQDALSYLQNCVTSYKSAKKAGGGKNYNIIFLDPPYRQGLLKKVLALLCEKNNGFIDDETLIYLEHESEENFNWSNYELRILKETSAGQVKSYLLGF